MEERPDIEELERRVDKLTEETHELKRMIYDIKRETRKGEPLRTNPSVEKKIESKKMIKHREPIDWEKKIGQVWLPRIFIFVLLLGVLWAFKAASDYGFINAPVKVGLGYISAGLLWLFGQRQIQSNHIALGQVLLGGCVVLLLIVTFSMHVLYGLIPVAPAFLLNIAWIALGITFSHRQQSEPLAILTGVGGYLIPFLLENENPNVLNFVVFETVLYLALLLFSMKKNYNYLYHLSFGLLHVTLLAGVVLFDLVQMKLFGSAVIIQHILLLATYFFMRSNIKRQMGTLLTSFLLSNLWIYFTFSGIEYEVFLLISFATYSVLSAYLWKKDKARLPITLTIATLALLFYLVRSFEFENIIGILLIQGLCSLYLGLLVSSKLKQLVGFSIYLGAAYKIFTDPFEAILSIELINWVLLLASIFVLRRMLVRVEWMKEKSKSSINFVLYVVSMLLFLVFLTITINVLTEELTLNLQYMTVSFTWAIYALVAITVGTLNDKKKLRVFGLILLFVTLAKLIFADLSYISIVIRAVLFIGLGLIGVIGSRIYYKKQTK